MEIMDKADQKIKEHGRACPYCKGKPSVGCRISRNGYVYYYARCLKCGRKGPEVKCLMHGPLAFDTTMFDFAIMAWNNSAA